MRNSEFKMGYDRASKCKIKDDDLFLTQAWWWLNLTELQLKKMGELMEMQGTPTNTVGDTTYYVLANGLQVRKAN